MSEKIAAILFDIGGVLSQDIWETVYFSPDFGLVEKYGISPDFAQKVGEQLWQKYAFENHSRSPEELKSAEVAYWNDVINTFGIEETAENLIAISQNLISPNEEMFRLLQELSRKELELCIVSNNTSFWFAEQWKKLDLSRYFDKNHTFVSCGIGISKTHPPDKLFSLVIKHLQLDASRIFLIDDRAYNVEAAAQLGIKGYVYSSQDPESIEVLKRIFDLIPGGDT